MAKSKVTGLAMTGKVQIRVHSSSSPILIDDVACTYQKESLFCIRSVSGRIKKNTYH